MAPFNIRLFQYGDAKMFCETWVTPRETARARKESIGRFTTSSEGVEAPCVGAVVEPGRSLYDRGCQSYAISRQ